MATVMSAILQKQNMIYSEYTMVANLFWIGYRLELFSYASTVAATETIYSIPELTRKVYKK